MKKALISTFTYGNNYGQRLQNFALQNLLDKYGYETWTYEQPDFEYRKRKRRKYFKNPRFIRPDMQRSENFKNFDNNYIRIYKSKIPMKESYNKNLSEHFDLFVTGSDQVWNPYSPDVNDSYFLDFVPKEKKLAFAPSFAVESVPQEKRLIFQEFLNDFLPNRISVREEQGAAIIKELTGMNAPVILDPTLLLDGSFWSKYSINPNYEFCDDYILVYTLGKFDLQKIKDIFPNKIIVDLMHDRFFYSSVGPQEFLWLIQNATIIFTDSYHCMIFCLLFDKKFQIINRESKEYTMKSRISTLCEKFNISENDIMFGSDLDFKVRHEGFLNQLNLERIKTKKFLSDALL